MESAMTRWGAWLTASAPRWPATTGFRRPPRIDPRRRQAPEGVEAGDDDGLPARAGGTVRDRSRNRPRRHGDRLSCDRQARDVLEAERWGAKLQEQFCRVSRNVPEVYAHDTEGAYFYIAMEYLEG